MEYKAIINIIRKALRIVLISFFGIACIRCSIITHDIVLDRDNELSLAIPEGPNKKRCVCVANQVASGSNGYCEEAWWNDSLAVCVSRDLITDTVRAYSIIYFHKGKNNTYFNKRQDYSNSDDFNDRLKELGITKSNLKHRGYLFRKHHDDIIFDE